MNSEFFERIKSTHDKWAADELDEGQFAGRGWAERDASYVELCMIRADLPKADLLSRLGEVSTTRLPDLLGDWWVSIGAEEMDVSISFQIGFMQGAVAILEEYEAELSRRWCSVATAKRKEAR